MIKVSTTGMAVSLKTDLRFPISGQWGHGDRIIHTYVVKQFNIANNNMTGNTKESTTVIFLRYLFVTALPPDSIYTQDL